MDVRSWLLEGDPSVRWQVMRHLDGAPDREVARERSRVATEGWGKRLLALQGEDGNWGGGSYSPKWISTTYTLLQLRHYGIDPAAPPATDAVGRVPDMVVLGKARPFFSYTGETCITGMVLALGAYFGALGRNTGGPVVDFLLEEQLEDGGWNCEARRSGSRRSSFNTTISVLEGLAEQQRARGPDRAVTAAMERGHEYLLARKMFRSLSTGEVVKKRWTLFSFPPRWHYDVLRGLDHLRDARVAVDPRCDEALDLVESKRRADGRWPLQNHHRGREHLVMEQAGKPSRWNTLRALRVLRWAGREAVLAGR